MNKIRLKLAGGVEVEFSDREAALEKIREWGERGTRFPQVVFGPEGCGKSSWLRQSIEALKEMNYDIIYINPIEKIVDLDIGLMDLRKHLLRDIREATNQGIWGKILNMIIDIARELIRLGRGRVAVIVDEAFHVIGVERSALYVKALLGVIEYPPANYERIVAVVATSEGLSRREIGRHLWAEIRPMWNMSKEGFKELYEQIPGDKPSYEDIWRVTGGNPRLLGLLYSFHWDPEKVVVELIRGKGIEIFISSLGEVERRYLLEAIEDPDTLLSRERIYLLNELVKMNLVVDNISGRENWYWIDHPPPEKDPELGI
ncbi:MAG: ATP-binding protein, partial [Sulfolobales archaeon]